MQLPVCGLIDRRLTGLARRMALSERREQQLQVTASSSWPRSRDAASGAVLGLRLVDKLARGVSEPLDFLLVGSLTGREHLDLKPGAVDTVGDLLVGDGLDHVVDVNGLAASV